MFLALIKFLTASILRRFRLRKIEIKVVDGERSFLSPPGLVGAGELEQVLFSFEHFDHLVLNHFEVAQVESSMSGLDLEIDVGSQRFSRRIRDPQLVVGHGVTFGPASLVQLHVDTALGEPWFDDELATGIARFDLQESRLAILLTVFCSNCLLIL